MCRGCVWVHPDTCRACQIEQRKKQGDKLIYDWQAQRQIKQNLAKRNN